MSRGPPGKRHTPARSRHPPKADTPMSQHTPWEQTPPLPEHAGRYGQHAAGTHHTGMQSCYTSLSLIEFTVVIKQGSTIPPEMHTCLKNSICGKAMFPQGSVILLTGGLPHLIFFSIFRPSSNECVYYIYPPPCIIRRPLYT